MQSSMGNGTGYVMCVLAAHPRAARFRGKGALSGKQRTVVLIAVFVLPPKFISGDSVKRWPGDREDIEIWPETKSSCLTSQLTGRHAYTHRHTHHRDQDAGFIVFLLCRNRVC